MLFLKITDYLMKINVFIWSVFMLTIITNFMKIVIKCTNYPIFSHLTHLLITILDLNFLDDILENL